MVKIKLKDFIFRDPLNRQNVYVLVIATVQANGNIFEKLQRNESEFKNY